MNKLLRILLCIFSITLNVFSQDQLTETREIISSSNSINFKKWVFMMNGDSVYHFENDQGERIYVYVVVYQNGNKYEFEKLKYGNSEKITTYSTANEIGDQVKKLHRMIEGIKLESIKSKSEKSHLIYLFECLKKIK